MKFKSESNTVKVVQTEVDWRWLYRLGAIAILVALIFFRRNYSAELMVSGGFGIFEVPAVEPASAASWFDLLQAHPYVGLSLLGALDLGNYVLLGLFFLALAVALRTSSRSLLLVVAAAGIMGVGIAMATNQAFNLLSLSQQYQAAPDAMERSALSAAGEALLAIHNGSGFYLALLLVLLAGLVFSVLMFKSSHFGKTIAVIGILANSFGLGQIAALVLPETVSWILPTLAAPLRLTWYILAARGLLRLASRSWSIVITLVTLVLSALSAYGRDAMKAG